MEVQTHIPVEPLNSLFKECYYIHIEGEKGTGQIPVIDDCCYDLVFFKEASGLFYYGTDQREVPIESKVFTVHDVTPPYRIEAKGSLTFFTIKLQPWVNAHFFSSLRKSGVVPMEETDSELLLLHQNIFDVDGMSTRFSLAEEFMENRLMELSPSMNMVREICQYIHKTQGKISVNEVSGHFKKSRQYLGKVFKKEVMYSLKKFIVTVRILDLVKYKSNNPEITLTELSHAYGYFDQAHFINDFKKVCGVRPLEFFKNLPQFMVRHR